MCSVVNKAPACIIEPGYGIGEQGKALNIDIWKSFDLELVCLYWFKRSEFGFLASVCVYEKC